MSETPTEDTCQLCSQTRVLFTYEHGLGKTSIYRLCTRCWEKADASEAAGDALDLPALAGMARRYVAAMRRTSELALVVQPA